MAERWIFQDIVDIETEINRKDTIKQLFQQSVRKFLDAFAEMEKQMLHERNIDWKVFAGYCLWRRDICVSLSQIKYEIKQMYDVSDADIINWLFENKEEHHVITQ